MPVPAVPRRANCGGEERPGRVPRRRGRTASLRPVQRCWRASRSFSAPRPRRAFRTANGDGGSTRRWRASTATPTSVLAVLVREWTTRSACWRLRPSGGSSIPRRGIRGGGRLRRSPTSSRCSRRFRRSGAASRHAGPGRRRQDGATPGPTRRKRKTDARGSKDRAPAEHDTKEMMAWGTGRSRPTAGATW